MTSQSGIEDLTGFMIEWSLSLDNVFAISMIVTCFAVPRRGQHRVLFRGMLGAIAMRGVMIALGATRVGQFSGVLYIIGAFRLDTGVKMLWVANREEGVGDNPVLGFLRRRRRVTDQLHGERFSIRQAEPASGKLVWFATPLFLCFVLVEAVDLIVAIDSVPAIFAITRNPFIVYTSSIFAILGLRALHFALAATIHRVKHLTHALALVLGAIGTRVFLVDFIGKFPPAVSLGVTFGRIAGEIGYCLGRTGSSQPATTPGGTP